MIWRDKTGRYCATPPEHIILSLAMQQVYKYDSVTSKPTRKEITAAWNMTVEDKKELQK